MFLSWYIIGKTYFPNLVVSVRAELMEDLYEYWSTLELNSSSILEGESRGKASLNATFLRASDVGLFRILLNSSIALSFVLKYIINAPQDSGWVLDLFLNGVSN